MNTNDRIGRTVGNLSPRIESKKMEDMEQISRGMRDVRNRKLTTNTFVSEEMAILDIRVGNLLHILNFLPFNPRRKISVLASDQSYH